MTKNLQTQELTERPLNELFQNYWTEVYSFAKKKTKDHHKAQDLTCETFTKAFIKLKVIILINNLRTGFLQFAETLF